jgi:hypothetical protein
VATAAPVALNVGFGTPFQAQIDFLRAKLALPTERWDDIQRSAHDRAFIVAGAAKADLVADLQASLVDAATTGKGLEAWRREFADVVKKHGWTGWTGEGTKGGEAWRTKVIYQTNMSTSYAAGRYKQMTDPDYLQVRPYWRYLHSDSVMYPRPLHLAWHGLTLPHDHPFWKEHYPPNGWGCQCRVTTVGKKEGLASQRAGLGEPPAGWDKVDPKTGAPVGIDRGFDYTPGASTKRPLQEFIDDKLIKLDAPIGAAMWQALKPALLADRAVAYREWLADLAVDVTAKSRAPVIGAIDPADLKWLAESGKATPSSAEISISSSAINGPKAARHEAAGDSLPAQAWEQLPELIDEPLAVLYDAKKGTLLYVLPEQSVRRGQVVVEFDFTRKDFRNMIVSAYRPKLANLKNRVENGSLIVMRGGVE